MLTSIAKTVVGCILLYGTCYFCIEYPEVLAYYLGFLVSVLAIGAGYCVGDVIFKAVKGG